MLVRDLFISSSYTEILITTATKLNFKHPSSVSSYKSVSSLLRNNPVIVVPQKPKTFHGNAPSFLHRCWFWFQLDGSNEFSFLVGLARISRLKSELLLNCQVCRIGKQLILQKIYAGFRLLSCRLICS